MMIEPDRRQACTERLKLEQGKLEEQMQALRLNLEELPEVTDYHEVAEMDGRRDTTGRLITSISEQMAGVQAALQALEDGTYGRCHDCGKHIPEIRLNALPFARHCIDCSP